MQKSVDRSVLNVVRQSDGWVVELDGGYFGHSPDKEIAKATANKHARQLQDGGRACQVRVHGESGFFAV